jgi:hypothetical protein
MRCRAGCRVLSKPTAAAINEKTRISLPDPEFLKIQLARLPTHQRTSRAWHCSPSRQGRRYRSSAAASCFLLPARADELAAQNDYNGAAVWRRITHAVGQLANQTSPGPLH